MTPKIKQYDSIVLSAMLTIKGIPSHFYAVHQSIVLLGMLDTETLKVKTINISTTAFGEMSGELPDKRQIKPDNQTDMDLWFAVGGEQASWDTSLKENALPKCYIAPKMPTCLMLLLFSRKSRY